VRLALIAAITVALLACESSGAGAAVAEEAAEEVAEVVEDDDEGRADEAIEQPESVPDTVGDEEPIAEPEPSPYLAGWIYLLDKDDTVIYSHEEPSAQLRAAYYDMAAKCNRQEREGYPFRVVEGGDEHT
jgi:hypothetical protein